MCFSTQQAQEFYARLKQRRRQQEAGGVLKEEPLVPKIDVLRAQATKEEDKVRIFQEIEKQQGGIEAFNAQLQDFMERALQEEARAAMVAAAAGSIQGGEGRVTLVSVQAKVEAGMQAISSKQAELSRQQDELSRQQREHAEQTREAMAALGAKLDAALARLGA